MLRIKCPIVAENKNVFFTENSNAFDDKGICVKSVSSNIYENRMSYNPGETITEKNSENNRSNFSGTLKQFHTEDAYLYSDNKKVHENHLYVAKKINGGNVTSLKNSGLGILEDIESEFLGQGKRFHKKSTSNPTENNSLPTSLNQLLWDNANINSKYGKDESSHGFASDQYLKYTPVIVNELLKDKAIETKFEFWQTNYMTEGNNQEPKFANDNIFDPSKRYINDDMDSLNNDEPLPEIV